MPALRHPLLALLGLSLLPWIGCQDPEGTARVEHALGAAAAIPQLVAEPIGPALPASERGPRYRLALVDPGGAKKILPVPAALHAAPGPDGTIAVVDEEHRLWTVNRGLGSARIDDGVALAFAFSPDGRQLAYARRTAESVKHGVWETELWTVELQSGLRRPVLGLPVPGGLTSPAFSEDGSTLFAVGADERTGLSRIVSIDLASRKWRPVTNVGLPPATGDGRAPAGFVPVPVGPAPMEHRAGLLRYFSGDADVELEVASGRARVQARRAEVKP